MKAYYVSYKMTESGEVRGIEIHASSKAEAWDLATYEVIPAKEGSVPYSAWVSSVTYNNGNYHQFNTCEGLPY